MVLYISKNLDMMCQGGPEQIMVYGCMDVYGCLRALKGFFLYKYTKKVDIWSFFLYKNRHVYGHLNP